METTTELIINEVVEQEYGDYFNEIEEIEVNHEEEVKEAENEDMEVLNETE